MAGMKNRRNYYRILHVDRDAPPAVIKASYRALMQQMKVHPDLGGDAAAAALVNEAYATLSDPARRAAYDRTLSRASRRAPGASSSAPRRTAATPTSAATAAATASTMVLSCAFCGVLSSPAYGERRESTCTMCGSPLCPARRHKATESSRRALERVPREMPLSLRRAEAPERVCAATTRDVSLNGMRVLARVRLAVGERIQITCPFCSAVAVVKSVTPGPRGTWESGVEFITLRLVHDRGGLLSTRA
jgi:hypothetical protein